MRMQRADSFSKALMGERLNFMMLIIDKVAKAATRLLSILLAKGMNSHLNRISKLLLMPKLNCLKRDGLAQQINQGRLPKISKRKS